MNFSRRLETDPFGIEINPEGIPFFIGEVITNKAKQTNDVLIAGFSKNELIEFADEAFIHQSGNRGFRLWKTGKN